MSQLEYIGYIAADAEEEEPLRHIFVLALDDGEPWPSDLALPSKHLALFLACDADRLNSDHLRSIAASCIDAGAALICTWGTASSRVDGMLDDVRVARNPDANPPVVTTTSHEGESLDSALHDWLFTFTGMIEDELRPTCRSWIACSIGDAELAHDIRQRLADPQSLFDRALTEFVSSLSSEEQATLLADDDDDRDVVDFAPATGAWPPASKVGPPSGPSA